MDDKIAQALLSWHDANKRDLPWNGEKDPYRIWLSEIMLQQTRTETAKGYYHRFLEAFPDVFALAEAEEEKVLKCWEGLGYYSRARNLLKTAKIVARERSGAFPDTVEGLKALPGIGEYTAGAIASVAYGRAVPSVDANQQRAIARLFAIREDVSSAAGRARVKAAAMQMIDPNRPGDFNHALMGLGAMVCLPKPKCDICPVVSYCEGKRLGIAEELPVMPEKRQRRVEHRAVAVVFSRGRVLLLKRTGKGMLQGMFEFPNFLDAHSTEDVAEALAEIGVKARFEKRLTDAKHIFTHVEWHMTGYLFCATETGNLPFYTKEEAQHLAIPSAFRAYREFI
ncbi:MAG: A/G-specific adenine glycosylase [Christensenellales bacterium]|jgi:A/G-specific adenine glycosylase